MGEGGGSQGLLGDPGEAFGEGHLSRLFLEGDDEPNEQVIGDVAVAAPSLGRDSRNVGECLVQLVPL